MPVMTLAEIDATTRKAARGCGCPWGLAEEAGKSARWLASHGLPGAETLATLLHDREGCCAGTGKPCALAIGASLADRATEIRDNPVETGETDASLILLAQMGRAADALDRGYVLEWEGGHATLARHAVSIEGDVTASRMTCRAATDRDGGTPPSPASRMVADDAWAALNALAHRILVPATDASRAGAGAGTRDND